MAVLDGLFLQNTTYDYDDNYEYVEDSEGKGSEAVWIPVLYSVVTCVGLLGNLLLLVILYLKRCSWSMSDTFILHLVVADVLLLVTLPFRAAQATQHSGWCFGFFCKICGAVFYMNFYCGIFLLVCITLDHCCSSIRHVQLYSHRTPSVASVFCFTVWLVSLLLTIPDWIFLGPKMEHGETQCVHSYPESKFGRFLSLRVLHHAVGFLLPTVILITCCSCLLVRLQPFSNGARRKRPAMLIIPCVAVFLLCWMPYNITLFADTFSYGSKSSGTLKAALRGTSALGSAHACLRPLLYLFLCGNFRKQTLSLLRCAAVECKSSLWDLGVGEEAPQDRVQRVEELQHMTSSKFQDQSTQA